MFKKQKENVSASDLEDEKIEKEISSTEKPQQSFIFENEPRDVKIENQTKIKYKLPSIEFLEKSSSKTTLLDINRNRPDAEFMEKILLDFGINGKIKTQEFDGLLSTCVQHEINHLDGKLIIDHLSKLKKDMIIKKISKIKKNPDRIIV